LTSVISSSPRELAARRGAQPGRDVEDPVVVEVQARDGVMGARLRGLLLDPDGAAVGVELHHAVALRVVDPIAEYRGTPLAPRGALE
jgi:hypothetical protein